MAPRRKKPKPNPEGQDELPDQTRHEASSAQKQQSDETNSRTPNTDAPQQTTTDPPSGASTAANRASWYGSWRSSSKSSPVAAQLARESISVAQGATKESSEATRPPASVSKSVRGSRKSVPLAAEATRVHATSDVSNKSRPRFPSEEKLSGVEEPAKVVMEEAKLPPEPAVLAEKSTDSAAKVQSGTWFWWSRPDGYGYDGEKKGKIPDVEVEEASSTPLPGTPVAELAEPVMTDTAAAGNVDGGADADKPEDKLRPEMAGTQKSSRSWFGLWSSTQNEHAAVEEQATKDAAKDAPPEITVSTEPQSTEETVKDVESSNTNDQNETKEQPRSSGWAFWSSDKPKDAAPIAGGTQKRVGELAVADTPSQSRPEAAQFNEQQDESNVAPTEEEPRRSASLLRPRRGKNERKKDLSPEAATTPQSGSSAAPTPSASGASTPSGGTQQPLEASSILSRLPDHSKPSVQQQQQRPNLILPSFDSTFPLAPNPGYVERLTNYLASSLRIPGSDTQSPPQHVFRSSPPPKVRKAIALGIHGYFPGILVQKFIGQPRGTSVRFANYAATAMKAWCNEQQPEGKEAEIETVALEGEGIIADRVATLWKLLLNWLSHIKQADFILVACHSQGVPVAIMLVAKLIQLGCLSPNVRVGVCAMAGINLGPFLEYRSRLWGSTADELFEFADAKSSVSRAYAESLDICLRNNVRVTLCGSLDDQLVSMESSLHMPVHHPYVNRAVYIDGRIHAPNFLTHLVVFAIKLRNLGVSDHGLIRELSAPLAGSIVGGEGHSRIYDEPEVYKLAIDFALGSTDATPASSALSSTATPSAKATETAKDQRRNSTTLPTSPAIANNLRRSSLSSTIIGAPSQTGIAPIVTAYEPPPTSANVNPFYLPWAVRGMLEEDLVKREMRAEVEELVREFDNWKPTSKVLKDVRFRLECVRGMV
ncbi:hypothetical protein LTR37_019505 [Vermiconidia calcicola]|uniref:Uncharacterized protein n=1 Tax=Vermiconidia calcicola TaxID=1690605 RepID=A0ACC3MFS4_9PEZI|nr:hypothetical protein LTR37_019505 [Vermiconidia calcicola]